MTLNEKVEERATEVGDSQDSPIHSYENKNFDGTKTVSLELEVVWQEDDEHNQRPDHDNLVECSTDSLVRKEEDDLSNPNNDVDESQQSNCRTGEANLNFRHRVEVAAAPRTLEILAEQGKVNGDVEDIVLEEVDRTKEGFVQIDHINNDRRISNPCEKIIIRNRPLLRVLDEDSAIVQDDTTVERNPVLSPRLSVTNIIRTSLEQAGKDLDRHLEFLRQRSASLTPPTISPTSSFLESTPTDDTSLDELRYELSQAKWENLFFIPIDKGIGNEQSMGQIPEWERTVASLDSTSEQLSFEEESNKDKEMFLRKLDGNRHNNQSSVSRLEISAREGDDDAMESTKFIVIAESDGGLVKQWTITALVRYSFVIIISSCLTAIWYHRYHQVQRSSENARIITILDNSSLPVLGPDVVNKILKETEDLRVALFLLRQEKQELETFIQQAQLVLVNFSGWVAQAKRSFEAICDTDQESINSQAVNSTIPLELVGHCFLDNSTQDVVSEDTSSLVSTSVEQPEMPQRRRKFRRNTRNLVVDRRSHKPYSVATYSPSVSSSEQEREELDYEYNLEIGGVLKCHARGLAGMLKCPVICEFLDCPIHRATIVWKKRLHRSENEGPGFFKEKQQDCCSESITRRRIFRRSSFWKYQPGLFVSNCRDGETWSVAVHEGIEVVRNDSDPPLEHVDWLDSLVHATHMLEKELVDSSVEEEQEGNASVVLEAEDSFGNTTDIAESKNDPMD